MRFIEIFKRLVHFDRLIVTSLVGRMICESNALKASYFVTTKWLRDRSIVFTYLVRVAKALSLRMEIRDGDTIYSASDFLTDTLPAFAWKLRTSKANWIICVFLLVPMLFKDYSRSYSKSAGFSIPGFRRVMYFLSQQLTIFLGKRWANQILVLNRLDKEYLVRNRGVLESKVTVVEGGVDCTRIRNLSSQEPGKYDGVFLGRFHSQKGIFDLMRIWKSICNEKPDARLCVIGWGPQLLVEKIKTSIEEKNLWKNVDLVGPKTNDEKFILLKSARVFLCPSYYESFAIVIAEAMACGLPVVAYSLPIYRGIYRNHILQVPTGDTGKFAEAVTRLLDNDGLRRDLGIKGQRFVERYDWGKVAERECEILARKG